MNGDGFLLIAFSRCNAPARASEWSDWYDEVHLPELLAGGVDVVTRFELTQLPVPGMPSIGFSHIALYEFRGPEAEDRLDATLALDAELEAEGRNHPHHCLIDVDVLSAHGTDGSKSDPAADLEGHILAYVLCSQRAREAEWDAWYDATHLPDMMDSGAFRAGSRWVRRIRRPYGAHYLTLYDVAGRSVEDAVEVSASVMPGIAAAGRKLDCHVGGMSFTVRASGQHGGAGLRPGA